MELNVSLHFSNLYKEINDILRCSSNTHHHTKTDFYKLRRSIFCSNLTALRISSQGNFFHSQKNLKTTMHSSRMYTTRCSGPLSCMHPSQCMYSPCHAGPLPRTPFATHPHHACPSPCHTHPAMHTLPVDRMTDTRFWNYYLAPKLVCGR